jgi:hypothetical protein
VTVEIVYSDGRPLDSGPLASASEGKLHEEFQHKDAKIATTAFFVAVISLVPANARDDGSEPSEEEITEYAFKYMKTLSAQKLSDREIANQLASAIFWSEKMQLVCPLYFHVNARRARFDYLLRQGTWQMMFGVGKTATSILNEAVTKRNGEYNNSVSKKEWCAGVKAFGIRHFGWGPLFEQD